MNYNELNQRKEYRKVFIMKEIRNSFNNVMTDVEQFASNITHRIPNRLDKRSICIKEEQITQQIADNPINQQDHTQEQQTIDTQQEEQNNVEDAM